MHPSRMRTVRLLPYPVGITFLQLRLRAVKKQTRRPFSRWPVTYLTRSLGRMDELRRGSSPSEQVWTSLYHSPPPPPGGHATGIIVMGPQVNKFEQVYVWSNGDTPMNRQTHTWLKTLRFRKLYMRRVIYCMWTICATEITKHRTSPEIMFW